MEVGIGLGFGVRVLQLVERGDEGLGDVAPAIRAKASGDFGCAGCHLFTLHRTRFDGAHDGLLNFAKGKASVTDEVFDNLRMFFSGCVFNSAGNVDAPGAKGEDGLAHIAWMEAAGDDDAHRSGLGRENLFGVIPVEGFAGAP